MAGKSLIYKDNRVIEASYRLTLREQRLVLLAISQVKSLEKLNENRVFTITASEYAAMFGGDTKIAFRDIKVALDELFERYIKVIASEDKTEIIRWISKKSTTVSNQSVEIRFTPDIAPYLSNLKGNFTKYQLLNISGMSSIYSIRIYEMLMQWKCNHSLTLTIDQLKDRLQTGSSYPAFANLRQKVLDVAVTEINECSDIDVAYVLLKSGQKVESVRFGYTFKEGRGPKPSSKADTLDMLRDLKKGLK